MKYIEDCLEKLDSLQSIFPYNPPPGSIHPTKIISQWDQKFISDVSTHTMRGSPLSSAQAALTIKILGKYTSLFTGNDLTAVKSLLQNPVYRLELYQSMQVEREVRWAGGSTLLFRSQYNAIVMSDLKRIESSLDSIIEKTMIKGLKTWKIIVDDVNYKEIMAFVKRHNFVFDDGVLELFMHINNHIDDEPAIKVVDGEIKVEINNDVLSTLWIEEMEWLRNV